jgi:hypothetical protein
MSENMGCKTEPGTLKGITGCNRPGDIPANKETGLSPRLALLGRRRGGWIGCILGCSSSGQRRKVLATDIKTDLMERLSELPNVTVLKHNVDQEDTPAGTFDLIHTRVVLMHGGINRTAVIQKLPERSGAFGCGHCPSRRRTEPFSRLRNVSL